MKGNTLWIGNGGSDSLVAPMAIRPARTRTRPPATRSSAAERRRFCLIRAMSRFRSKDRVPDRRSTCKARSAAERRQITGGAGADTYNITAASAGVFDLAEPISVVGDAGDVLYYNENGYIGAVVAPITLTATTIEQSPSNATLTYGTLGALVINGPNTNLAYSVYGTSALVSGQTTIFAGSGNNNIYVYPDDGAGNLTINGTIGIGGQGGRNGCSSKINPTQLRSRIRSATHSARARRTSVEWECNCWALARMSKASRSMLARATIRLSSTRTRRTFRWRLIRATATIRCSSRRRRWTSPRTSQV